MAAGTALQATLGFGLALVAAPLLVLIDRSFVPGPLIAAALLLTVVMTVRERHAIDLRGLPAALLGRLVGTPPAALAVGVLSGAAFDALVGVLVLLAVAVSLVHREIQPTPRAVFLASVASGAMGTVSSIGGPPMALVYQRARGAELRATLSATFVMGCVLSLTALALVGRFGATELRLALLLSPGVPLGLVAARPLARVFDRGSPRPYVLGLSSLAAAGVLARALL